MIGNLILGYVSRKIRRSYIRILSGDRVKIEVRRYDTNRGRIVYRLRNKDSKDYVFSQRNYFVRRDTIQNRKFQETSFLRRSGFKIKVRSDIYENKSFCS